MQIRPCNCLYSAIAFLENWKIDEILMEVLQAEKNNAKNMVKVPMHIETFPPQVSSQWKTQVLLLGFLYAAFINLPFFDFLLP